MQIRCWNKFAWVNCLCPWIQKEIFWFPYPAASRYVLPNERNKQKDQIRHDPDPPDCLEEGGVCEAGVVVDKLEHEQLEAVAPLVLSRRPTYMPFRGGVKK